MRKFLIAAVAAAALAAPAAAQAHVTLQPTRPPAGGFTRLDVRVPNERDDAATTKVELQLPAGFIVRLLRARPGLEGRASSRAKLDRAGQDRRRTSVTEQVGRDHLDQRRHGIAPGAVPGLRPLAAVPGKAGRQLTFKALQTYGDGEVVRWIGARGRGARRLS